MDVCLLCLYVVLSSVGRGLCDGLITRPEQSYRVSVCVWSRNPERQAKGPSWTISASEWMKWTKYISLQCYSSIFHNICFCSQYPLSIRLPTHMCLYLQLGWKRLYISVCRYARMIERQWCDAMTGTSASHVESVNNDICLCRLWKQKKT
jgi:hypothetical protein